MASPTTAATPASTAPPAASRRSGHDPGGTHWEAWLLRALLGASMALHALDGNMAGLRVAAMGFGFTLVPPLITRFSGWHVPRLLEATYVLAIVLQFVSESFKLFEVFTYWDKLVHPAEIFLSSAVAVFLFLGYRHVHQLEIPDGLAASIAMLFGIVLGLVWELIEFGSDWFLGTGLQKSNADTMTDIQTNIGGAIFGTLLGFWLYRHRLDDAQQVKMGEIADWLTGRLARLFERHGVLVGIVFAVVFAAIMLYGWYVDRGPLPPLPSGRGEAQTWTFAGGAPDLPSRVEPLLGSWQTDARGICRVNPEEPLPGSEKMGLLALDPGDAYGDTLDLSARYFLARPPLGTGTMMHAGLAFGVRDADNFYLLEASATHDIVALKRYIHGRERWQREVHLITRGEEWHDLQAAVRGDRVTASLDGRVLFEEGGLEETAGGVGLWARVTSAGCFSQARVDPRPDGVNALAPAPLVANRWLPPR